MLRHIAYTYSRKQQEKYHVKPQIPVLLVWRQLLQKQPDLFTRSHPPDLPTLIREFHIPNLPTDETLKLPPNWETDILRSGRALVLLDGFDEVSRADRPAVARWLTEQMRRYHRSIFIVTSRPKAYKEQDPADRLEMATQLWIQPFGPEERQKFVEQWYWCQERAANSGRQTPDVQRDAQQATAALLAQIEAPDRPNSPNNLRRLARNPLLLTMIATFHRRFPTADLPQRRVELYQDICRLQLKDRPQARKLDTLLRHCDAQIILQMLALEMMQKGTVRGADAERVEQRIDRQDLLQQLSHYLADQNESVDAADFLQQVVEISELLVETEAQEYDFAHLSFQEYLAAAEIARLQREDWLHPHFDHDQWKPVILFYIGLVRNPGRLLRSMLTQNATDLAYTCWQETTRQLDADLVQQLTKARYAKLENYLQNQQWVEADRETYRLMITTVGKDVGQWFEQEELLNFPCEELKTIDQLWVRYSNGHFGFSVQKEIYVACGAKLDGNYPGDQIWEAFGDRVGWRKEGEWLSYSKLNPSLSSPQGIFPVGSGGGGGVGGVVLFSRIQACEL